MPLHFLEDGIWFVAVYDGKRLADNSFEWMQINQFMCCSEFLK